jgi:SAM-dependent methyltransferase
MFHVEQPMKKFEKCPVTDTELHPYISCVDETVSKKTFQIDANESESILVTNPRPSLEDLGSYYESDAYISHTDSAKGFVDRIYQAVKKYALVQKRKLVSTHIPDKSLLDIGCGTGDFLLELKRNGWKVSGMEPNSGARAKAEQKLSASLFSNPDLSEINDGSWEGLSMWHVLEHVPDPNETVSQLWRILKKGGIAIIAVPNFKSWDAKHYKKHWAAFDVPRHLFHFSQGGMKDLFLKNGFSHLETKPMIFDSFYVSLLSEKYKSGRSNLFSAFWSGLRSNRAARRNGEYSSLIYVFKKQ